MKDPENFAKGTLFKNHKCYESLKNYSALELYQNMEKLAEMKQSKHNGVRDRAEF